MANVRVTQAGRQSATQQDADVRVTQAGRNVMTADIPADVRVTQAGRNAVTQIDADLRVTQAGRTVVMPEARPSQPAILRPATDELVALTMTIAHTLSVDPIGGTTTHTFRYREIGDSVWIVAFTGRAGNDDFFEDVSAEPDGNYEAECFSNNTGGTGKQSITSTVNFVINNGAPGAPTITSPLGGQEWDATNHDVTWLAAVDPDDDALTYSAQYRIVGSMTWLSLFTGLSALIFDWDLTGFAVDDWELEVWANDGTSDGEHDYATFVITALDRPSPPQIRIIAFDKYCVTVEANSYDHPVGRAWKSTTIEIIPFGGDFANPTISVTVTEIAFQLINEICGLAPGFRGQIRVTFTDVLDQVGVPSQAAEFVTAEPSLLTEKRWDRDVIWSAGGPGGVQAQSFQDGSAQEQGALVDVNAPLLGSVIVTGQLMFEGCNCGLAGRDTELREMGLGIYDGTRDVGDEVGVSCYLETSTMQSAATGIAGNLRVYLKVHVQWPDGTNTTYSSGLIGGVLSRLVAGLTNTIGSPIGSWVSGVSRDPWYPVEVWIQRTVGATPSTRIRAKVFPSRPPDPDEPLEAVTEGEYHIDETVAKLGPCGLPGFMHGQLAKGAGLQAKTHYRILDWKALRDLGLDSVTNLPPLIPVGPAAPGLCLVQPEVALQTPVFFPVPPNGGVREFVDYTSDVMTAWDDSEQRASLRQTSKTLVSWTGTMPSAREATNLEALLYEDQPKRWGVPMWMDAAPLLADLSSGSSTIPDASVDKLTRRFDEMTHVALWVDQFIWDFVPATLETNGDITLDTMTTQAFVGGAAGPTFVLPCRVGRIAQRLDRTRESPTIADIDFEFVLEGVDF